MAEQTHATTHGVKVPLPDVAPLVQWSEIDYTVPVREEYLVEAAIMILRTRGIENPNDTQIAEEVVNRQEEFKVAKRAEVLAAARKEVGKITDWLEQQGAQ